MKSEKKQKQCRQKKKKGKIEMANRKKRENE